MKCICDDWKENEPKLNSCTMLAHIHDMPYDGKTFEYCPWCGKELLQTLEEFENELSNQTTDGD